MTVKEYLEKRGAYGVGRAVSTRELVDALHTEDRHIKRMVANERAAGALICSTTAKRGGYFLPATVDDVLKEAEKLERGIVKRAAVLAPFRAFRRKHQGAEREKKETSLFPNMSK